MTDPLDGLREPVVPADPDPAFAARLRARLDRLLGLPRGVHPMSPLIPYLAVPVGTGRRALDWYADVLGARITGEPIYMPDGKLGHAELDLAGATIYLAEEFPDIGHAAPGDNGTPVGLWLTVPDAADAARRAIDGGATLRGPIADRHGHRNAEIVDPFGHRWMLQTPLDALPETVRQGDVGYAWLTVPDPDRAADFYAAVLGWTFAPGSTPGGREVEGQSLPMGLGRGDPGWHVSYAVDDVAAAVDRVRAAGGTATDPDGGPAATCVDDQGSVFALHRAGSAPRPPENGARQGDLSYLTLQVADSARFRAFYGQVLGLRFEPGRITDGWAVPGVTPMTGISGGHEAATAVPMWKVDDVPAAVERVRAAGGTATDPEKMPYGLTADCRDDQGMRFYLGDS